VAVAAFQVDGTDTDGDGIVDLTDPDDDGDGVADLGDNCPLVVSGDQLDTEQDGIGDLCDPIPGSCTPCLPGRGGWRAILQ
jgi:hypothetical protein